MAGYHLFSTGEVLSAANVNDYLMKQTVMIFASASARTTALSGVVREGMVSYRTDSHITEYYNGSAWVTLGSTLTTKGDLQTFDTAPNRLSTTPSTSTTPLTVTSSTHGYALVQDQAAPAGLNYTPFQVAGKNKIINGDFGIWQRGTSFTANGYNADRWSSSWDGSGSTTTISQQTFTPGTAPVAGYEGTYFWRFNRSVAATSGTYVILAGQRIEDVRTYAGQTVTLSYWAKADSARTLQPALFQNFGSGGSGQVYTAAGSPVTLSTSWTRYTVTVSVPSISGKTIGTSSYLLLDFEPTTYTGTFIYDIWGVQLEAGSVATPFTTATGTLQGELAACNYYCRKIATSPASGNNSPFAGSALESTTSASTVVQFPPMRTNPSVTFGTAAGDFAVYTLATLKAATAIALDQANKNAISINTTHATGSFTAGYSGTLMANGNQTAYILLEAEL